MRNVSVLQTNVVHVPHERQERRPHKEFTTACIIHLISNTTAIRRMDDRTSFVQEVPWDLQCLPVIWAICVVEDVSKHLDTLTSEF